jgi:hypothetical protein
LPKHGVLKKVWQDICNSIEKKAMQQSSERNSGGENPNANRGHGPQGVDKAPGEETPQDAVPFTAQSQKGKKIDADPEQESERPASQEDL